jgi:ABC-type transport system involved in multi-copper enzyme maturation permease subunit
MFWSTNTVMVVLPLAGAALFLLRRNYGGDSDPQDAFRSFSDFLLHVFASFLIPICSIAYGATSIGGDREDRTLVFLLVRPVPRPLVLLAKFAASWPLTVGLTVGTYWGYCWLAGQAGDVAFPLYFPAIVLLTNAYICLFHFFAVCFRHATILALLYSLFMELLVGNMPGIIKRVALNYYGRSLMFSAGEPHGLRPPDARWFELLEQSVASNALLGIAAALLAAAAIVFQRREYRDLT